MEMKMEAFSYDGKSSNLQKAIDVHEKGDRVICSVCGSDLIIIGPEDSELIKKYQLKPGIYCPTNPKHIHKVLIFAEPFEKFSRRFGLEE